MKRGTKLGWVVSSPRKRKTKYRLCYAKAATAIQKSVTHLMTSRSTLVTINGPQGQIVNVFKRNTFGRGHVVIVEY